VIDVSALLSHLDHGAHTARQGRVASERLVAVLQGRATSAKLGDLLGSHPADVRKLRGQLASGTLLLERPPRPVQVEANGGPVAFSAERGHGLPAFLELTPDLAWLLGFYCAQGFVTPHPRRPNSYHLGFACGPTERPLAQRAASLLARIFDARVRLTERRTTLTVDCTSSSVARLFEALCGGGAKNKRVPPHIAQSPGPVIRAFLDGYLASDGAITQAHLVGGTVSRRLAYGLFELGLLLDLLPTFFVYEPAPTKPIEGRTVSPSTRYIVKFNRARFEGRPRPRTAGATWRDVGDSFLAPLRSVERVPYTGAVYNLEVDDADHSYLAPFLAVSNCQNWSISKSREMDTLADEAAPEAIARTAEALGCRSVAFTYNDPVVFLEYAIDVAQACHQRGLKTVAVTAGYMCAEPRAEFYRHMDAANVDLKGFTERFYRDVSGGHLQPVLETLEYLKHETNVWFELTTLLIPARTTPTPRSTR
jgi:hypothetical protein